MPSTSSVGVIGVSKLRSSYIENSETRERQHIYGSHPRGRPILHPDCWTRLHEEPPSVTNDRKGG
jgi:hypothetical protein